jgi:hypothetical protein
MVNGDIEELWYIGEMRYRSERFLFWHGIAVYKGLLMLSILP